MFFEIWKKRKIRILEHWPGSSCRQVITAAEVPCCNSSAFLHVRILTISGVTCSVISPLARSTPRRAGPERRRSAELPESAAAARRDRLRALLYTSDRKWKTDLRKMQLPLSLQTVTALCYKLDCSENSYEMLETHCVKNILRSSWFGACSPSQCTGARSSQKLWNPYQRWNCLN